MLLKQCSSDEYSRQLGTWKIDCNVSLVVTVYVGDTQICGKKASSNQKSVVEAELASETENLTHFRLQMIRSSGEFRPGIGQLPQV